MDAYNVAFRIPNLVRDLFAEGAMSAAFVPTFTRVPHRARAATAAWRLGNNVINALLVVTALLVVRRDRLRAAARDDVRRRLQQRARASSS